MALLEHIKKLLVIVAVTFMGLAMMPYSMLVSANQPNLIAEPYHHVLNTWQQSLRDSIQFENAVSPVYFRDVNVDDRVSAENSRGYNEDVVHLHSRRSVTVEVEVPENGLYHIGFDYLTLGNEMMNPEVSIMINGELQFNESRRIVVPISWRDATSSFETNRMGDELIPQQVQINEWKRVLAQDSIHLQPEPLRFHLQQGSNLITITNISSEMYLGRVYVTSPTVLPTYEELNGQRSGNLVPDSLIAIEAQHPTRKNSSFIRAVATQTPDVTPFDSRSLLLNTLGGDSWAISGQSVTYAFHVEEAGYYAITLKALQNNSGATVFRTIKINGEIPFAEMKSYPIPAQTNWRNITLTNEQEEPFYFYFEVGEHEITLVADASPIQPIIVSFAQIREEIRDLSLSVRQLTGNQVDVNRDWEIDEYIPGVVETFQSWIDRITINQQFLIDLYGEGSQSTSEVEMQLMIDRLERLKARPNELPNRIGELSEGASSVAQIMGELESSLQSQPLLLSQIFIHGSDQELPRPTGSWLMRLRSGFEQFLATFTMPRALPDETVLDVWVNRSRQYVELMQNMADNTFTPQTGIRVNFSVMPSESKLILANAANQQPDLALGVSTGIPYEMAIRGAAVDLTQFEDFNEVLSRFAPGAMLPMMLNNKIYGLPETQDFYVTFYRSDILTRLNVPVPDTWDEVTQILPELQRAGMNFFIPLSGPSASKPFMFTAPFIYQFGGDFYAEDAMSTAINSEESLQAIRFMTDLYMIYSLPLQVGNFYNDFRQGSLPIGVSNFETYIQLTVAAPEIANAWNIALHPGVSNEAGEVQRWATGSAQNAMILQGSDRQQESWELLKWWTSAETQTIFSNNLMTLFGPEFMWSSANLEAFANLPIPQEHKDVILMQWEWLKEVPRIPGSYIVEREVSNIWNRVVFSGENLRSSIDSSVIRINREIRRRMEEFGYIENGVVVRPYILPRLETVEEWIKNE